MEALSTSGIVGRSDQLSAIDSFLDSLARSPSCLVFEGPAGVGKTVLWRAAVDAARQRGLRVLEAQPVQAEATVAFAGVGDLLGPFFEAVVDELPLPQADALEVALMLRRPGAVPPGGGGVAVALLSALRVLAAEGPLLIAVDDLQWLDATSVAVLTFAWRRLRSEPIGLVVSWRAGERTLDAIADDERTRRVAVEPLSVGAVHQMLHSRLELTLPRPVLLRLHEVAGGNAFYALELGRALGHREVVRTPGAPLPVPERLRDLMRDRLVALPEASREALAATAALLEPTRELVADEFGAADALRAALSANVLDVDGDRLRFTHPLLATAAYEELDVISRRALHRRLAALVADEEERARHLALSADGPDAEIAKALDRAAEHARSRGATAAAADLCELAHRLSALNAAGDRGRRALLAARYRWLSGDTPAAIRLLEGLVGASAEGRLAAEAMITLAWVLQHAGDQPRAAALARRALAEPDIDDGLRAEAAHRLAMVLMYMREDLQAAVRHARLAAEIAQRSGDAALLARNLSDLALVQVLVGSPEAHATARFAADLTDAEEWRGGIGSPSYSRANVAIWTDRHEQATAVLRDIHENALLQGDEGAVPHVLAELALVDYLAGRWSHAARHAEAGYEAALQAGQQLSQAWTRSTRALVRASLGLEAEARADAREAMALAGARGMGVVRIQSAWALGLLELPLGRLEQAVSVLAPLRKQLHAAGVGEPGAARFIPDEIEALIGLGRPVEAIAVLEWLEERALSLGRVSALAAAARCRGLLAAEQGDHDAARAAFDRALAEHERLVMPFERARTLLALGTTQRRTKQRAAARRTLGQALTAFENLGASLWSTKAAGELARISGRRPQGAELTATERRTAELVAQGLSNKAAAAVLFVTPKTIETQLSRIYAKLSIHSRTELALHMRDSAGPANL